MAIKVKVALAATILTAVSAANALGTGFEISGGLGQGFWQGTTTVTAANGGLLAKSNGGQSTIVGQGLLGYDYITGPWLVGGEAFGRYTPNSSTLSGSGTTMVKTRANYSFGADVKGGYELAASTYVYGLLGVESTHFSLNATDNTGSSLSYDTYKFGFMPGFGFMMQVTPELYVDTRYTWTNYPSFTRGFSSGANVSVNQSRSVGTVSVGYKFL